MVTKIEPVPLPVEWGKLAQKRVVSGLVRGATGAVGAQKVPTQPGEVRSWLHPEGCSKWRGQPCASIQTWERKPRRRHGIEVKAREAGWPSSEGVGEERQEGALESFVSGPECAAVFFLYSEMVVFMFVWLSVCMCVGVGGEGVCLSGCEV